jgi:hypothetical protein
LREVCGAPDQWRDSDAQSQPGRMSAGTEIYEPEGTQQIAFDEGSESEAEVIEVVHDGDGVGEQTASFFNANDFRRSRHQTSITNLTRLQELELTSMINVADLDSDVGAEPLVDLDALSSEVEVIGEADSPLAPIEPTPDPGPMAEQRRHSAPEAPPPREPRPQTPMQLDAEPNGRGGSRVPWLIIAVILLIGVGIAAAIGLSGPNIERTDNPETPTTR